MTEATKPTEPKKIDPKALAEVANRVDLNAIRLEQLASIHEGMVRPSASMLNLEFEYQCSWRRRDKRPGFDVRFEFKSSLSQKLPKVDTPKQFFSFEATYVLEYSLQEAAPEDWGDRLDMFANVNGVVNVWPYVRAEHSTTLAKMGLPPLMLPIYRPGRPNKGRVEFRSNEEESSKASRKE